MNKNNFNLLIKTSAFIFLFSVLTKTAYAQWKLPDNSDFGLAEDLDAIILTVTNWLLGFVGLIAVLAIVYGGFQYVFSTGDDDRMQNAKRTIKWAIMGLIYAGIAYAIVYVIINVIK